MTNFFMNSKSRWSCEGKASYTLSITTKNIPVNFLFGWLLEVISFGSLSKLYKNLKPEDKKAIAKTYYNVPYRYVESWLRTLSNVRNVCAHFGRLYNKDLTFKPLIFSMDIVLGAMEFRLNNKHLAKVEGSERRGKRTIAKEKLYKHIYSHIRDIYPNFNIGESTGLNGDRSNRWKYPYRHWKFIAKNSVYNQDYKPKN